MVSFFTDRVYLFSSLENDIERVVTISGHDALYPSEQSDTTVDRVPWFSETTRFYQNQTVSTTELSHSINGWANSMCPSTTTFCGLPVRCQFKKPVGPFHRSLFYWAASFPRVSASLMQHLLSHKFRGLRWEVLNLPLPSVTISPAGPGILSLAYPAADAYFTLVWLDETSGLALANIWEVYVTTLLAFLWPNISTPWTTVFLMSRCLVWLYAVELTHNESSVR